MENDIGLWSVLIAVLGGAIRVGTPFIFVSLGECLTEKAGRINLGLEGNLIMGAMTGYAVSYLSGSPWLGVLAAGSSGCVLGILHALLCQNKQVNDIAVGIAMMLFATGIAFFYGKAFIQPSAPHLPSIGFGNWSSSPVIKAALDINVLFFLGVALAPAMAWFLRTTRWGNAVRVVGESSDAALSLGMNINRVRLLSTMAGGGLAGIGGSYLSLYYPGSWSEGLSSGQGLMAVALVIFARWNPMNCLYASLLFGGAAALGPALQSVGINWGYYLFNAAPYVLTLVIMIAASSAKGTVRGMPGEFVK
ncbi:MAG: ABC transporter permease [Zhongshania sp.]|uniref:ABC transporter permease n=1 Tax=Zhongshania sp. TaxID=1971902 RepID=UPI00260355B6|nr:ABC transporter permease [Zhongshania sp.]MDF1691273.1 ABC transporter permease [Zhongshania sp.]